MKSSSSFFFLVVAAARFFAGGDFRFDDFTGLESFEELYDEELLLLLLE